ncbi:phosphotransferase family protein [Nocardia pseudobrasiliensis]|uniref:Aminoglycoside phosphotransferase (APT) family kinase protein n=1 Tax=Nocardia pseudobrasiliensis TaxID=45979 RepID=A0A370I2P2_9NOCA|nr:phosphotransferase family protein [Nocardia pseudobrasiliensis]RDI64993.1 aminoglycoside phosphotransferase (APT) family kinase protein [Nocardia pseudobrasiliensis]
MTVDPDRDPGDRYELTISARDLDDLAERLARWLAGKVHADGTPKITNLSRPQSGGMSSGSVLFDASWERDGRTETGSYVVRMPPETGAMPVFETYDLTTQYGVMAGVAEHTDVPVPRLYWLEDDESVLGSPFFVMGKVDGRIPEDNPPYVFVGWLFDSTPEERLRLTRNTVDVIARIHAIEDPAAKFPMLASSGEGSSLRQQLERDRRWYNWALADDGYRIPLLERTFDWLEKNFPADPGPDVLSWGDSRPGNIIYNGFEPVAVLDWEMATLGPRELDVAWVIFIHRFFQDIATQFHQPGLPDYLRREDVVAHYESSTGHTLRDLDWYIIYAALRHGIVMARVKRRMIHFGEDQDTDDRDNYVMHRASLESLLAGTYEWD